MKPFADVTTNLATCLLAAGVAVYLMAENDPTHNTGSDDEEDVGEQVHIPEKIRIVFVMMVGMMAIFNFTGFPQKVVDGQWEDTIFGEKFFPTTSWGLTMSVKQKRMLAGIMEMIGLLMTRFDKDTGSDDSSTASTIRAFGYGIIFVMYSRGTMINARIALSKALATLIVATTAAVFLSVEMENDFILTATTLKNAATTIVRDDVDEKIA